MSATVPELAETEEYSSKTIEDHQSKENPKNGLVNGLICTKKTKKSSINIESDDSKKSIDVKSDLVKKSEDNLLVQAETSVVNNTGKSKKRSRKKKHKNKLDSNENVQQPPGIKDNCNLNVCQTESLVKENINTNNCDKAVADNEEVANLAGPSSNCQLASDVQSGAHNITKNLEKLIISPDSNNFQNQQQERCNIKIQFVQYESELQMQMIMKIIQKDLSEPYSIYTYRYFIHNWPKLCFLAMHENQCVGAIVCKLDIHRKAIRRGYIAMLAVDQEYRKLRIGSTLVEMAIHEMTLGDADEVVLETEVTNKPALKLYEKLGFVRDKRLFRYYLNGVDALRLKLWLR